MQIKTINSSKQNFTWTNDLNFDLSFSSILCMNFELSILFNPDPTWLNTSSSCIDSLCIDCRSNIDPKWAFWDGFATECNRNGVKSNFHSCVFYKYDTIFVHWMNRGLDFITMTCRVEDCDLNSTFTSI